MTAKCDRCDATDTVADADTKLGHDYADATCTAPKTCKRNGCSATVGEALGHQWNQGEVTKEPTKKAEGEKTYICENCGATKAEAIPMLTGCGGGSGVSAAFISCGGITALWFTFKRRIFHH